MNIKRRLISVLPRQAKRILAVPYDFYQTRTADRAFQQKTFPEYDPADNAPDHIVCVVVDALRADHATEELTPAITDLRGTSAITPGSWTFPAVSSILSGLYPHSHGAMRQTDTVDDSNGLTLPPTMGDNIQTLTEILAGAGYHTYGGFGHDTPFVALSGRFHTHKLYHKANSTAEDVFTDYLDWVRNQEQSFAFLHLAEPHIPVDPPAEYRHAHDVDDSIEGLKNWRYQQTVDCDSACQHYRKHRRRLYRAAVDHTDDMIGSFVQQLNNVVSDPLLIVTADHGEALWEHVESDTEHFGGTGCVDHGGAPYEELARVPLYTTADWTFDGSISLVDLFPTILDHIGIDGPDRPGYSLLQGISSSRIPIVEGSLNGYEKKAVYYDGYKLIVSEKDNVELSYQLPKEERTDIPEGSHQTMIDALPPWPDGTHVQTDVSGVVEDRLNKLGYR